jgi:hypothetical protein
LLVVDQIHARGSATAELAAVLSAAARAARWQDHAATTRSGRIVETITLAAVLTRTADAGAFAAVLRVIVEILHGQTHAAAANRIRVAGVSTATAVGGAARATGAMLSLAVADLDASANLIDASAVDRAREADSVAPQTRVGPDRMTPDRDPGLFHLVITAGVATARDDEQKSY